MFYESELMILRETFRKCHIQTQLTELSKPISEHSDRQLHRFLSVGTEPLSKYLPPLKPATVYRMQDPFDCHYCYMLLPEFSGDIALFIGPFLPTPPSHRQVLEWAERNSVSPTQLRALESFYESIPILPDSSHLFALLEAFGERLWGVGSIRTETVERELTGDLPLSKQLVTREDTGALWRIQNIEQRYSYENELMDAVAKGQHRKADQILSSISVSSFDQRTADPVRNAKNYAIIMNTLLRKSAERGGVHPLYLDSTSSDYAIRIEQVHNLEEIPLLMAEMFQNYCQLVRRHATGKYSPPIQKALLYIEANLTENLSLRTLAEALNVSSGYLSGLFRRETGQTLTEHVNHCRVRHAMHLLKTTRLQIQTVAQHCGIMDVQYFSKIFKRLSGMTPKEYRAAKQ